VTVGLYIAAAATGFDNILAALWIVAALLFVIGAVVAWRRRRAAAPR
jgi:LPXTG-motif cell wall-anchored protein